jgi:hypothetical protein
MTTKPKTFQSDLAHLPLALAPLIALDHWVLWRWELRKGIWTKPPFMTTGRHAKNNDPSTWAPYQSALAAVSGSFDGIGFALLDTPFDVVDLDHCLDPATGHIDEWARAWIDAANGTYVERTPSGEGLRIIAAAISTEKLHHKWHIQGAREKAAIEIYRNAERYITVTGIQIGECNKLGQVNGLLEQIQARFSKGARNGASFDFNNASAGASIDYDEVIKNGAPEGKRNKRSELFQACVWHLAAKRMSADEIVAELSKYPNGIATKYIAEERLRAEVERSYSKWKGSREVPPAADEPEEPPVWDTTDKHGNPRPTRTNTRRALRMLGISFSYDEFHDRLLVEGGRYGKITNLDHCALMLSLRILKAHKFEPTPGYVLNGIIQICLENRFDPVRDYLDALQWDRTPRLERWTITYLGAEDTKLNREFGRLALIAAVRRVRRPGTKFDSIIVLEGPMGTEKSKAIETLAGIENFSDQTILGARDKEQQELLAGVWLYEIAELSNIRKTEVEHIKAFASRTHDRARPAFGRVRVDQPRRCVLFATTNEEQYLKEPDRRFWPIRTTTIDIEALKRDRDQLWAEAAQQEAKGKSIVLDRQLWGAARVEQEAREDPEPWDDKLAQLVGDKESGEERVLRADIMNVVLGLPISKQTDFLCKRLSKSMRRLGWKGPKRMRTKDGLVQGYSRPINGDNNND